MWALILPLILGTNPCEKNMVEPIPAEYIPPPWTYLIPGGAVPRRDLYGPVLNKWDVVIVGDRFTDTPEDRALFIEKADEVIDNLAEWTPYRRCAFNFHKVFVASAQQGVDYPLLGADHCRNTALNLGFGYIYSDGRRLDESWLFTPTPSRSLRAAEVATKNYDLVITLAYDKEQRGGLAWVGEGYPDDPYPLVTVSIGPGMHEVAPHEVGHRVAFLHEEYDDLDDTRTTIYTPTYTEQGELIDFPEPNVTAETDRTKVKWKEFIQATTPTPTTWDALPDGVDREKIVGLWEGAAGYDQGVFRPQHNCLMREADTPFCQICEHWVRVAMAFRCKWDYFVLAERLRFNAMSELVCREKYGVIIPLPACLPCLRPDIDSSQWVDPGVDTIRIEIGPLPSGTTMFVLDDLGQTITTAAPAVPDTLTLGATFEAEPLENYFLEIRPVSCPDDVLPVEAQIFINGWPAALP